MPTDFPFTITDEHGQHWAVVHAPSAQQAAEKYAEAMHAEYDWPDEMLLLVKPPNGSSREMTVRVKREPTFHAEWKDESPSDSPMSAHDRERVNRALSCDWNDLGDLSDALVGLQSTDHPSILPLHDKLMARWRELRGQSH